MDGMTNPASGASPGRAPGTERRASTAQVTLVVVPRERFGLARRSLEDILANTSEAHELVYVDAGGPAELTAWITEQAKERGFTHVRVDRPLSPNEARNLGARHAATPYVVFLDNDVFVKPGWLAPLVEAADETKADIVVPLTCHGWPLHQEIHQAGGEFAPDPKAFFATPAGQRQIVEVMHHQGAKVDQVTLTRSETQLCEFHAVLVRRDLFDRIGPLDEEFLATKEHLDLCMRTVEAGGRIVFEPRSVATYLFPNRHNPLERTDWPFFLLRWSQDWQWRSLMRMREKWGLSDKGYLDVRRDMLDWRHWEGVLKPQLRKVPVVGHNRIWLGLGRRALLPLLRLYVGRLVARAEQARRADPGLGQPVEPARGS